MTMKKQTGISSNEKKIIMGVINLLLPGAKIYLFGSRAVGAQRPGSDIDIAIDLGKPADRYLVGEARNMIYASSVPYKTDIVDMQSVSEEMLDSIKKQAVLWKS